MRDMFFTELLNYFDNNFLGTLFGTLLAGVGLAAFGLRLYHEQKKFDVVYLRKIKIQELATALLTNINVAMKDYRGQIVLFDGSNPPAKILFDRLEEISPQHWSKTVSERFQKYIIEITKSFDDLSTPLALEQGNETKVKTLAETVPALLFLFSTTTTLPRLSPKELKDVLELLTKNFDKTRNILQEIAQI